VARALATSPDLNRASARLSQVWTDLGKSSVFLRNLYGHGSIDGPPWEKGRFGIKKKKAAGLSPGPTGEDARRSIDLR
jgi:hypothetical protein